MHSNRKTLPAPFSSAKILATSQAIAKRKRFVENFGSPWLAICIVNIGAIVMFFHERAGLGVMLLCIPTIFITSTISRGDRDFWLKGCEPLQGTSLAQALNELAKMPNNAEYQAAFESQKRSMLRGEWYEIFDYMDDDGAGGLFAPRPWLAEAWHAAA